LDDDMLRRYKFPVGYSRDDDDLYCLPRQLIPAIAGKLDELKWPSAWATESDWLAARQEFFYIQEMLAMGCKQIIEEQQLLLARAHGLSYDADLTNAMPETSRILLAAETADTTDAMAAIYNHPTAATLLQNIIAMLAARLGYEMGGSIEQSLASIEAKIDGASDEEVAQILQLILAML
jgi:hypothetical protein